MIDWLQQTISPPDRDYLQRAEQRQMQLTKPPGSLGRLESLAVRISGLQKSLMPDVSQTRIMIFAADHGIAHEGVSAFPQSVTAQMVRNFSVGGAAVSVLARQHNLPLQIVNLGLITELEPLPNVINYPLGPGSENFLYQDAMSQSQFEQVFDFVRQKTEQFKQEGVTLLIAGEMGIANTTTATALVCALENLQPEQIAGRGTGLDDAGLKHKISVINQALDWHKHQLGSAEEILRVLGGFEIAALCAAYLACAQQGIISLVDGFICTVAALFAIRINPACQEWLIFSHLSGEAGHKKVLQLLDAQPLLDLNLRLGEASGAALAWPLIQSACLLHNQMATFESASVSTQSE